MGQQSGCRCCCSSFKYLGPNLKIDCVVLHHPLSSTWTRTSALYQSDQSSSGRDMGHGTRKHIHFLKIDVPHFHCHCIAFCCCTLNLSSEKIKILIRKLSHSHYT